MKLYIKILTAFFVFFIASCDDYVDEIQPTAAVSENDAYRNEQAIRVVFNGVYRRFRFFNDGAGDDSEAIGAILNSWNVQGNDILRSVFHWFIFEYIYDARKSATGRKVNLVWKMMYELINTSNTIMEKVGESNLTDAQKLAFTAEARAIRGMCYHYLVREYGTAYLVNKDAPGVPIYLEAANIENSGTGNPRAKVSEVYDVIVEDLEFAAENLTENRLEKWQINKSVAQGLLARCYLDMGKYAEAAQSARSARQGWSLNAESLSDGFNDISSSEWMWGAEYSSDQTLYYGGFGSFWDGTRYPRFTANPSLVNQYTSTDVRAKWFEAVDDQDDYNITKIVSQSDFGEDVPLMRVAEMYLIEAEGLARSGSDDGASSVLYELQLNRDPSAVKSNNTGNALVSEIMLERRKELFGEMGPDFIDARRLGQSMERDEMHGAYAFKLVEGDYRFIMKLPQDEIDSNDAINEENQNQ